MCLITEQMEPFIAEEDMRVYKTVTGEYESTYECFPYEKNKLFEAQIKNISDGQSWYCYDKIDESYLNKNFKGWRSFRFGQQENLRCIETGFHSTINPKRLGTPYPGEMVVECTIPKGSEYYLDATGCVVSNQIIVH